MRTALRILGRLACWLLVVVGGFAVAVFAAVLVSAENSDQRLGSVVLDDPRTARRRRRRLGAAPDSAPLGRDGGNVLAGARRRRPGRAQPAQDRAPGFGTTSSNSRRTRSSTSTARPRRSASTGAT